MRPVPAFLCPLLLVFLSGCASSSIQTWQRSLEEFVENKGDGDGAVSAPSGLMFLVPILVPIPRVFTLRPALSCAVRDG